MQDEILGREQQALWNASGKDQIVRAAAVNDDCDALSIQKDSDRLVESLKDSASSEITSTEVVEQIQEIKPKNYYKMRGLIIRSITLKTKEGVATGL